MQWSARGVLRAGPQPHSSVGNPPPAPNAIAVPLLALLFTGTPGLELTKTRVQ